MNFSDKVAFSDTYGFYDPVTFEALADGEAAALVQSEHAAGLAVEGIDDVPAGSTSEQPATNATNQANLNAVAAQAAAELGLTDFNRTDWSPDQRVQYMTRFKQLILQNPDMFTAQTVHTAQVLKVSDLGNASISNAAEFGVWITDAVANAASQAAASVPGQAAGGVIDLVKGMSAALSSLGKSLNNLSFLIPIGIAFFGYLAIKSASKDPAGQAKKLISSFV